jgi:hypothetical protein
MKMEAVHSFELLAQHQSFPYGTNIHKQNQHMCLSYQNGPFWNTLLYSVK